MKDYYQTNKGRLLGIGGILIIVGIILYFARGQEAVLVLPVVGVVLFIAGVIYKPRKKKTENVASEAQWAEFLDLTRGLFRIAVSTEKEITVESLKGVTS